MTLNAWINLKDQCKNACIFKCFVEKNSFTVFTKINKISKPPIKNISLFSKKLKEKFHIICISFENRLKMVKQY